MTEAKKTCVHAEYMKSGIGSQEQVESYWKCKKFGKVIEAPKFGSGFIKVDYDVIDNQDIEIEESFLFIFKKTHRASLITLRHPCRNCKFFNDVSKKEFGTLTEDDIEKIATKSAEDMCRSFITH